MPLWRDPVFVVFGGWLPCMQVTGRRVSRVRCITNASRMLTKWFHLTRLETRTKESNSCASVWVANPCA